MQQEPQYFDCDEDGNSREDRKGGAKIPKWSQTTTIFQVKVLEIFGMKYFSADDRDAKKDLIEIESGMAPIAHIPNFNKTLQGDQMVYPFPKEWVDFVIGWTKNQRQHGVPMSLRAMINYIRNKQKMIKWLESKKLFVFVPEKKYGEKQEFHSVTAITSNNTNSVPRKPKKEDKDASLEAKYANFPD